MNQTDKTASSLSKKFENEKNIKLVVAILIDLFGFLSYLIPGLGELFDLGFAPISAILVYFLFGKKIKWAAFTFLEELIPFTDAIPSATIAWYAMYVTNELDTIDQMAKREREKTRLFNNRRTD